MLDQNLKNQVTELFSKLKRPYVFSISAPSSNDSSTELKSFLEEVAACSENLICEYIEDDTLYFDVHAQGEVPTIKFKAIPTGHEFTTLLLAVLNMDGIGKQLPDDAVKQKIKSLKGDIHFDSYISLTCTNCPDVVQAINILSITNPNITHHIIDGGINQSIIDELNIQAVPTVYMNGEPFHVGRSNLGELLQKLEDKVGSEIRVQEPIQKSYDVVIAGGGPAGVSAAIYTARKGFSVALVADKIGGQVVETVSIENMISVPSITGKQLSADMSKHLSDYKIDVLDNRMITNLEVVDGMKTVKTSLNEDITTPSLIIATGASWRKLNVPGEKKYIGNGVAFCTHCDGPFYASKKVIVVGGGNSGLEAAIDLSSIASDVTILEFMDVIKGDQVLQDKIDQIDNINIITQAATKEIIGDGQKVIALKYEDRTTEEIHELPIDGVFVQIGLLPNSGVFKDVVETNKMGEIMIDANCRTNVPGVYAAGDVSIVPFKQIVIAMGEGSKAALSSFEDEMKGKQISA